MLKVGIIGATGYTGVELIKILLRHPGVKITSLFAKLERTTPISEIFPALHGRIERQCENFSWDKLEKEKLDLVFLALPHQTSLKIVPHLLGKMKVVDLSADYRLRKVFLYQKWYQFRHPQPLLLRKAVYGLPEIYRERIKGADLVATPGCYPTSVILAAAPLMKENWVDLEHLIVDAKSGVSGAGRIPQMTTLFPECNENIKAYQVTTHRHTPEMEMVLGALAGQPLKILFTPHLIPLNRGILSVLYFPLKKKINLKKIKDLYRRFYQKEPFVRILAEDNLPETKFVQGTNYCDLGMRIDLRTNKLIIISAIDNLIKGAAGQAVQNMNLMAGFEETTALV